MFRLVKEGGGIDRVWPFDIIPRSITSREWQLTDDSLKQRVQALNMFIADIYDQQKIISDGVFPKQALEHSVNFRQQCVGIKPANESGGYGMMVGSAVSQRVRKEFAELIKKNPRNYIAQPTLNLSTVPTFCDGVMSSIHVI